MVAPFALFLREAKATEVLDLGSGAAGPARLLARALAKDGGTSPLFVLTDLHPRVERWEQVRAENPSSIQIEPKPVDATAVPPELGENRARAIINVLHHLPPDIAGAVLRDGVHSKGIFVAEGFERSPLQFANFAVAGLPALLLNPILSPERRVQKALLTWFTPIALLCSIWDGLVSTLRVYTEAELRRMVEPTGDAFLWTYGTYRFRPFGKGYYFYGVPNPKASGARQDPQGAAS